MLPDTDSDLALAIALAEHSHGSSQDDDFQQSLHPDQLYILKSCGSFSGKRSSSGNRKRQKKDHKTKEVLESLHNNRQQDRRPPGRNRVQKRGKENQSDSGDGLRDTGQGFKLMRKGKENRSGLEEGPESARLRETSQGSQLRKLSIPEEAAQLDSPSKEKYGVAGSLPEDTGFLHTADKECGLEEVLSLDEEKQQLEEVVSLDEDKECLEKVVSLDEDIEQLEKLVPLDEQEPNAVLSQAKRRRPEEVIRSTEFNSAFSSARNVHRTDAAEIESSDNSGNEIDFRRHMGRSQIDASLPSININSGSQLSALLRLCSDATNEKDEAEDAHLLGLVPGSSHQPSLSSLMDVSDRADVDGSSEAQEEDIMSLMTQVRIPSIERSDRSDSCECELSVQVAEKKSLEDSSQTNVPSKRDATLQNTCLNPGEDQKQSDEFWRSLETIPADLSPGAVTHADENPFCNMPAESDQCDLVLDCPICGVRITGMSHEQRELHTNACLDKIDHEQVKSRGESVAGEGVQLVPPFDVTPVLQWLERLNLSRYANVFIREEIDWDTLKWLTDEDLNALGITALGPRRKIVHSLQELREGTANLNTVHDNMRNNGEDINNQDESNDSGKKLITDFFPRPPSFGRKLVSDASAPMSATRDQTRGSTRAVAQRKIAAHLSGIPEWMSIPGTKFRVDAFQYLRGDCCHWFLTHFHTDHYQGLTRGFRYGNVYCSSITARLVNTRIGVPWERLKSLPLNEKVNIDGVNVTFLDANHCPGSVMVLFEPPTGKAVLHTGDFRFCEDMANNSVLQGCTVHTLILDTTYCNPQYDFPKQEVVIQFIIEAIQAEAFNPSTLFLIGTYTIGKERIFLEVAKVLQKKVYIGAAKLRLLQCMHFTNEDMQWLTTNDQDSHIHVVPLWTIASFKRMSYISRHYHGRYNSIVAFSPTGWSYGRGKKRTPGRRWQQGTIIRYETPYSEHCSFKELQEFVKFIAPVDIVPSVHNDTAEAADAMVALLLNEEESS